MRTLASPTFGFVVVAARSGRHGVADARFQRMRAKTAGLSFGLAVLAVSTAGDWLFLLASLIATASLTLAKPDNRGRLSRVQPLANAPSSLRMMKDSSDETAKD